MPSLQVTDHQHQIMMLLNEGNRPSEVADILGLSRQSISSAKASLARHREIIKGDLAKCLQSGLITSDDLVKILTDAGIKVVSS